MQLNGQTLKVGQTVATWIGSANRDSHYFNDADSFNIHRPRNPLILGLVMESTFA